MSLQTFDPFVISVCPVRKDLAFSFETRPKEDAKKKPRKTKPRNVRVDQLVLLCAPFCLCVRALPSLQHCVWIAKQFSAPTGRLYEKYTQPLSLLPVSLLTAPLFSGKFLQSSSPKRKSHFLSRSSFPVSLSKVSLSKKASLQRKERGRVFSKVYQGGRKTGEGVKEWTCKGLNTQKRGSSRTSLYYVRLACTFSMVRRYSWLSGEELERLKRKGWIVATSFSFSVFFFSKCFITEEDDALDLTAHSCGDDQKGQRGLVLLRWWWALFGL